MSNDPFSLDAAQQNVLASVQAQVANLNAALVANYTAQFGSWAQSVQSGHIDNSNPPKPPNGYVVGYFNDPTTGGGAATPGVYAGTVVQWAYPATGPLPVCAMPPIPPNAGPTNQTPLTTLDSVLKNVPVGDTLPVGFKTTAPDGSVWQKQVSPTPWGVAYFYAKIG